MAIMEESTEWSYFLRITAIKNIDSWKNNLSLTTTTAIQFDTDIDVLSDAIECFLHSEKASEVMERHKICYDAGKELFTINTDYNLIHNRYEYLYETIFMLFGLIQNAVKNDTEYFSDQERDDVFEKVEKLFKQEKDE